MSYGIILESCVQTCEDFVKMAQEQGLLCADLWRLCEDGSRARLALAEVTAVRA